MSLNQWHQYKLIVEMLQKQYGEVHPILSEAEYNKKFESKITIAMNIADTFIAYFLFKGSKTIANLANFRTVIQQSIAKDYKQVLLFATEALSSSIDKFIKSENEKFKNRIVLKYTHHFNIEHGSGPFCGVHTIMSAEDIENEITKQHRVSVSDLKRIAQNDAQLQYLRANPKDVIRINNFSQGCGATVDYRYVTKPMEKGEALQNNKNQNTDSSDDEVGTDDDDDSEFDENGSGSDDAPEEEEEETTEQVFASDEE